MAVALLDGVDKFPQVPDEYLFGNGVRNCAVKPGGNSGSVHRVLRHTLDMLLMTEALIYTHIS